MTVAQQTPYSPYTGNGVTTVFPYAFKILDKADLDVYVAGILKTLDVDYTVSGVGVDLGGSVTFTVAPGSALSVSIIRSMVAERLTDYQFQGDFNTDTVNPDFDRAILLIQDVQTQLGRSIRTPADEVGTLPTLPSIANRSGKYIAFDANGQPVASSGTGNDSALRTDLANGLTGPGSTLIAHKRTAAEIAASIVPTNYSYLSHEVIGFVLPERYGAVGNGLPADVTNGALDTAAIAKAITMSAATKCPILLSRQYIAVPATASTQEAAAITVAWLMQTNLNVLGIGGASITLANSQSTDATPKSVALFHTNSVLSNISFKGVVFDLNGANNKISPGRPAVYENTMNMAAISVSGTPAGIAARVNDVVIEGCTFKNCPGVCVLVCGQSNSVGVTLGERWTIRNNLFINNGTDAQDHTSIFAWCNTVTCVGNIFWEDSPPHTVGKTGGATCYEVHGSNHRFANNYCFNYTLGMYVGSNFSTPTLGTVVEGNDFYCSDYGILLFRQQVPASAAVEGVLIEGNSFYFDNYTYAGQPTTRAAIRFQGQLGAPQQLAINNVKITGNYAIAAGTTLFSNFVRWDTVTIVAGQVCSNLVVTDNEVIGFTEGVYILTNAANGMGFTEISRNQFINLTPDGLGNLPRGIDINANGGFTTLVIDDNRFIEERGAPLFSHGVYLNTGTITDFWFGPQTYKGLTVANVFENAISYTNYRAPPPVGINTVTYSASMTPDYAKSQQQVITATNGAAFTINAPLHPVTGAVMTVTIRNAFGALGAVTWNAIFGLSAWTQPANNFSRSITFRYNGSLWIEISRTTVDVPN